MTEPARAGRRFAVVGSGASGCYAVEALLRHDPAILVDVIERLPTPFGLIRHGVAPDHQGTKAVTRTLERFLGHPRVRYFGSVTVGRDISLEDVRSLYDGVILATGVNRDRKLGLPGEDLRGVMGSGMFAGWYTDHPEAVDAGALLAHARHAVVIGAGNVALDVTRQLAKRPHDQTGTDISPAVEQGLAQAPLRSIHLVGRSGLGATRFSLHELKELERIAAGRIALDPGSRTLGTPAGGEPSAVERQLLALPDAPTDPGDRFVCLHFGWEPVAFVPAAGDPQRLGAVRWRVRHADGSAHERELPADVAITCVGYDFHDRFGLGAINGVLQNVDGRIGDRLYVVGWAKRGPSGTIAMNRLDSHAVVAMACAEVASSATARPGIEPVLRRRGQAWVDFQGWKRIDQMEIAAAAPGRVRRKLATRAELMSAGARWPDAA